jgi:hypothetical protein
VEGELLDYVERTVAVNGEQRIESPKTNAAALRPRATCQRGDEESENR